MLSIASDILPQTCISYVAFRIAFCETLERITLAKQVGGHIDGFGFLTEVPFLQAVPPQIQLDLLAETWTKHLSETPEEATLIDESVIYAICETASHLVLHQPKTVRAFLKSGPLEVDLRVDDRLATELQGLHLNLSNAGDFLMISQFEDLPPQEARTLKQQFSLEESRVEAMFEVLGRWHPRPNFLNGLQGLLMPKEIDRASRMLDLPTPA
jgi:hypothetical protein